MTIKIENISLTIDQLEILQDISLTIRDNSFVSLIAPSGAGKTTLLKILTGVISPTKGQIIVDHQIIKGLNTHFSYLPQEDMLLPWYNVIQNATLYQKINHQPIDQPQLLKLLQIFGLEQYQQFLPQQLSGGMRQRVAMLRTFMNPAKYLLLDEPFGALDAMTRSHMQDWLLSLPQKIKRTTILVTHDIEEAIYLSDRIIVLSARPAHILQELTLNPQERTRTWLASQASLKAKIYQSLEADTYNVH